MLTFLTIAFPPVLLLGVLAMERMERQFEVRDGATGRRPGRPGTGSEPA
jgi:hypothetical protein